MRRTLLLVGLFLLFGAPTTRAIDLNFEYIDTGEAPSIDPDGEGMMRLFDYAEQFYEDAFPGGTFRSNIRVGYGTLSNPSALGTYVSLENKILLTPSLGNDWFIDPTPADNSEFEITQHLWRDDDVDHGAWYGDFGSIGSVPATFEVGLQGPFADGLGFDRDNRDMLSTVLHEVGHALGLAYNAIETADGDYDFQPDWVFGTSLSALSGPIFAPGGSQIAHLENTFALMGPSIGPERKLPSHTDLMAMAASLDFENLDLPRREFYGGGVWESNVNWTGAAWPQVDDEAFVRLADAHIQSLGFAGSLQISEGAEVTMAPSAALVLGPWGDPGNLSITGEDSRLRVGAGGLVETREVGVGAGSWLMLDDSTFNARDISSAGRIDSTGDGDTTIEARNLLNGGQMLAYGGGTTTVNVEKVLWNDFRIHASGGSTMVFDSNEDAPWDLDGAAESEAANVFATGGHLRFADGGLADAFNGYMAINEGGSIEINAPWQLGELTNSNGRIEFTGDGQLRGERVTLRGLLDAKAGLAEVLAPVTLESGGEIRVADGAQLEIGGVFIHNQGGLEVEQGGVLRAMNSAEFGSIAAGQIHGDLVFMNQVNIYSNALRGEGRHLYNGVSRLMPGSNVGIGTVLVQGPANLEIRDALLQSGEALILGRTSVTRGGEWLNSGDTQVSAATDTARFSVSGSSSNWVTDGDLVIGRGRGTGEAFIQGGVSGVGGQIAIRDGSSLSVTGGQLTSGGALTAEAGSSVLIDGGVLDVGGFDRQSGSELALNQGSLNIRRNDGVFNSSLVLGGAALNQPTLRVLDGADVTLTSRLHLGSSEGTHARAVVSGVSASGDRRSTLRSAETGASADLYVGRYGHGELSVLDGGLADFGDDFEIARDGHNSSGTATVSGVAVAGGQKFRSEVNVTRSGAGSALTVGRLGDGVLNIEDGGLVRVSGNVTVASSIGSTGEINVQGFSEGFSAELDAADSPINLAGASNGPEDTGVLNVLSGGVVNAGAINIRDAGALNMDGGIVTTKNLSRIGDGGFHLDGGEFTLAVGDGYLSSSFALSSSQAGLLRATAFNVVDGADMAVRQYWHTGADAGGTAITRVSGVSADGSRRSTLRSTNTDAYSDLVVGRLGDGVLLVEDGGLVSFGDDLDLARDAATATGTALVRGVADVDGMLIRSQIDMLRGGSGAGLTIGHAGAGVLSIEDGALVETAGLITLATLAGGSGELNIGGWSHGLPAELRGPSSTIRVGGTNNAPGDTATVNLSGGGLLTADAMTIRPAGAVNMTGGELVLNTLDLTAGGAFHMTGGELDVETIQGDLVTDGGVVAPGDSPGRMVVNGDFAMGEFAQLQIELAGLTAAAEYDQLKVVGRAGLDGVLSVRLLDGYSPAAGDAFRIVTTNGLSGEFDRLMLPRLSRSLMWDLDYGAFDVTLQVLDRVLQGDFNDDGLVDSADYTVWRDNLGLDVTLPGDPTPGVVTIADYQVWRDNFGAAAAVALTASLGSGVQLTAVPEPAAILLIGIVALVVGAPRKGR